MTTTSVEEALKYANDNNMEEFTIIDEEKFRSNNAKSKRR